MRDSDKVTASMTM